jgi:hypothetical protein
LACHYEIDRHKQTVNRMVELQELLVPGCALGHGQEATDEDAQGGAKAYGFV